MDLNGEMPETSNESSSPLIGVINEGTDTASFVVISPDTAEEIAYHSIKVRHICPRDGWQEQDPMELIGAVRECINKTILKMEAQNIDSRRIVTIGITNQRETAVLWHSVTGRPLFNAIAWSDIRTASIVDHVLARVPDNSKDALMPLCGLPISPYFSALKIRWLIENVPGVRKAIREQTCMFGTVDSWIIWNLTGGSEGGLHITDVTNASRTMLMNIETLQWDPILCRYLQIPMNILPKIHSSSEIYGYITENPLRGIPISGILGNQQSALVGEMCLKEGEAKNTYRSGCFLMYNTGTTRVQSSHGLVTTVAYQMGKSAQPVYALEGSVAVAGAAVKWLKNNMNLISTFAESEKLADEVKTTGDVYFVPAFSGLYAPYWRKDARGILCGLTQFTTKCHIIRACLEAVCFQTRDILEAMKKDCGFPLRKLKADGTMTQNDLLMQLQADICGIPVARSSKRDVSSLGVAIAAGQAEGIGVWKISYVSQSSHPSKIFEPHVSDEERDHRYNKWKMAVQRSLGWVTTKKSVAMTDERYRLLASIPASLFLMTSIGLLVLARELGR
ncbi:glycerol kinase-like isoform X1 [Schistocerca nitens]|uniref:glycerol kinase-like isoform X1 n=2 Tax=Schistocerca nitens TaxID=7011 RepID=UPI0021175CAD|nr:glycerol kinase-like isoform X1 [Schistocerca nitens]